MKVYRSRDGLLLGVCRGIADRTGYPVKYFRLVLIIGALISFWWTAAVYLAAALLLPVEKEEYWGEGKFRESFTDLRDDTVTFFRREYRDFKEAGRKTGSARQ